MAVVLVVDDEDVLLDMLATLVEDLGHQSVTATNGQEALAILGRLPEPPAVILSDVMMPRMNGVEFARKVKEHPLFKTVPVLLMSAASRAVGKDSADHFIPKPFDLDRIVDLIQHYAGGQL